MEILVSFRTAPDFLTDGDEVRNLMITADSIKKDPDNEIIYIGDFDINCQRMIKLEVLSF